MLIVKGKTQILGKELPIIEGGFGEGKKAMLVKNIAEIHEVRPNDINEIISNNIDEFEVGIDLIDLKNLTDSVGYELEELGYTKNQISKYKNIYLLSEQGYMALVTLMRSEKAREIRKQIRRDYFSMREVIKASTNPQNDLFNSIFTPAMEAMTRAISENMNRFQEEMEKKILDTRNIITEQEIINKQQLQEARDLIGFKTKNTCSLTKLLKARLSMIKGFPVKADDYHYMIAKERLFRKYVVWTWEEIPVYRYNEIHGDIDSIEDLDDIYFS